MPADPLRSTTEIRVRYAESDQMGFAYHANYLIWCDIGRTELIRTLWKPYAEIEREGIFLAVTEASLRCLAPARFDDVVRVTSALESVRSRAVTFSYEIDRIAPAPEQRLAAARTSLIAIDAAGAPRTLPVHMAAAFRRGRA